MPIRRIFKHACRNLGAHKTGESWWIVLYRARCGVRYLALWTVDEMFEIFHSCGKSNEGADPSGRCYHLRLLHLSFGRRWTAVVSSFLLYGRDNMKFRPATILRPRLPYFLSCKVALLLSENTIYDVIQSFPELLLRISTRRTYQTLQNERTW